MAEAEHERERSVHGRGLRGHQRDLRIRAAGRLAAVHALLHRGVRERRNKGTFERNFNTRGGAQERRFAGGAQSTAGKLAKELGRRVLLGAPVRRIDHSNTRVRVILNDFSVRAKCVIVAIPPTLAGRLIYSPPMPPLRDQLTQRMPQGPLIKIEAIYDEPFWRAHGLTG